MRRSTLILSTVAAAFAASTMYFAIELQHARQALATARANLVALPAATPARARKELDAASHPGSHLASSAATADYGRPAAGTTYEEPDIEAMKRSRLAASRDFLAKIQDPTQRAKLLAETKTILRKAYPWMADRLRLGDEELDKFLDLMASQEITLREQFSRCSIDPACTYHGVSREQRAEQAQQIADLLGAERARQFDDYRESLEERRIVMQLRSSLPDQAYLSSELAESLIVALLDERRQAQAEAEAAGATRDALGVGNSMLYYNGSGSPAQQIASAEAYVQRIYARAAQILNPQQLAAFKRIQDESLDMLREQLAHQENNGVKTS